MSSGERHSLTLRVTDKGRVVAGDPYSPGDAPPNTLHLERISRTPSHPAEIVLEDSSASRDESADLSGIC